MMKRIVIFLLLSSTLFAQGWQWQYPKPQGNTLWDLHVINENTAVAVGELGTIIKTSDGGETWEVTHHICGMSGHLVSVYFQDVTTGWAVGSSGTMLKTTDGGENWTKQDTVTSKGLTSIFFVNADTGWVVGAGSCETGAIVLKSTDGGESWSSQIIGFHVHKFTSVYFTNDSTGWIVGDGYWGNEIFKTTDYGETWIQQDIEPRVYGLQDIHFIDEDTGFIVGYFGTFLKTTDGGETWDYQNLSEEYQKEDYQYFYSVYFVNADTGWIVGGDYYGHILKTTDGGENWVGKDIDEVQGHLYRIQFSDTEHGWAVGRSGLIYRTKDGGESWASQRDEQYEFNSIYFINEDTGWVVGEKGSIFYTNDGGLNWYKQNQSDSLSLSSIYAIDNKNVFAVGAIIKGNWPSYTKNGVILRIINNGQTWMIQTFDTLTEFSSIDFINDSTGWITVTNGTLLKTTDKGDTWKKSVTGLGTILDNIQFIDITTGWVSFYAGKSLLKTIDGGKHWSKQFIDSSLSMYSFHFVGANKGWAVGSYNGNNNIFKTTDGENWIPAGTPPISHYSSVYFINENIGWVVGAFRISGQLESTIIKTTDSGNTWHENKSPSTNGLSDIYFLNENIGWAVGNGIFKTITGGDTDVYNSYHFPSMPKRVLLYQNYPNPFNPSTTIRYMISKPGIVSLKIYDLLGREVETLIKEYQSAGKYRIRWTGENYPSGLYLYQLQAGYFCETRKFILTK